jgi:hypothetical protein
VKQPPQIDPTIAQIINSQQETVRLFTSAITEMTVAQKEQTKSFNDYLNLFKTDTTPTPSRVSRDQDEYDREMDRLGFPRNGTPNEQAEWVLRMTE